MSAERVEAHLSAARTARRLGRLDALRDHLVGAASEAAALPVGHPDRVRVAWKHAKVEFDHGDRERVLDRLTPLIDESDPFRAYPAAVQAVPRLLRAHQDRFGFGHPVALHLWSAWAEHHRRAGDRMLWAIGRIQLAWDAGCRGDQAALDAWIAPVLDLSADDLAGSSTRHALAQDAPSSLAHVQLEAAHTALRSASWSRVPQRTERALTLVRDALDEIDGPAPLLITGALLESARLTGSPPPAPADLSGAGFHGAYARALARVDPFDAALALAPEAGPEWMLAVRLVLAEGHPDDEIESLATRYRCDVFRR